jgi:uncharacterized protein (DUF1501 family)
MTDLYSRRQFVHQGLGMIGLGLTAPGFLTRTVWAMGGPDAPVKDTANDRVLVVLQLAGGNDGLNTIVPYRNDAYYKARPALSVKPKDVLTIDDNFGFHPAAAGLKQLYDEGLLAVVQGVGYPNPNRSHFVSTDIWESADPKQRSHTGWVGRYLDNQCRGADPPDPKLAIAIRQEAPLSLQGEVFSPLTFTDPNRLKWEAHWSNGGAEDVFGRLIDERPAQDDGAEGVIDPAEYLRRVAMDARVSGETIRRAVFGEGGRRRGRPSRFGLDAALTIVARLIAADLPTRVYYVSLSGFDTHANQAGRHQQLLGQLGRGLTVFMDELKSKQLLDRVVLMTFSEFGRRVKENASGGTDHGAAAPMFLVGRHVEAGVHGRHPSLQKLDKGDLIYTTDFRSVYADVLGNWLGADARAIVGGGRPSTNLIKV